MKHTNNKNISPQTILGMGAAAAALATASYYFFGPKGKTHRDNLKGWMIKMKGEIIERIEDAKELTEPVYRDIIDSVADAYAKTSRVSREELREFTDRLKSHWWDIVAESKQKGRMTKRDAERTTKRAAKKVVSKATGRSKKSKQES